MIRNYIPGLYMFVETTLKVWYATGYHKIPSVRVPKSIAEATDSLCEEELKSIMEEVCRDIFEPTMNSAEAMTHRNANKALCNHAAVLECTTDRLAARSTAEMLLKACTVRGARLCKFGADYIKMKANA